MKRPLQTAVASLFTAALMFAAVPAGAADTLTIGFTVSNTGAQKLSRWASCAASSCGATT